MNAPISSRQVVIIVVEAFSLVLFFTALTYGVARLLSHLAISRGWRYRVAFLISFGLGGSFWLVFVGRNIPIWLLASWLGAFTGGLLVTGLEVGLWENNSPPSQVIQAEVRQRHLTRVGAPIPEPCTKRLFDFSLALVGLALSAPVWLLGGFLVWFEDPGPVLFIKNSVGKGGVNFKQYKFRTMVREAENSSGPILSEAEDERVLRVGGLLRKTALDELPQLINILRGEMSFVGPRPQRTVLVHGYLETMPEYAERHRLLPGLSGLAQVAGDYYLTPRQKLRFDRLYIRHASLGFDLKLLMLAFLITFWYRWRKGWNERLPRKLLRIFASQRQPGAP